MGIKRAKTTSRSVSSTMPTCRHAERTFILCCMLFTISIAKFSEASGEHGSSLNDTSKSSSSSFSKIPPKVTSFPSTRTICGPKARSGRVRFRDWRAKLPWSTLPSASSCRWVSFGSRGFPAAQDVVLLLTADRIDASEQPHHPPNVWAESLSEKGFYACVHIPDVKNQKISLTKDRVAVSWMALNRFSARRMAYYVDMYHAYADLPNDSVRCRKNMPRTLDADSQILLTTALNVGVRFMDVYGYHTPSNKVEDVLTTWVQPSAEAGAQQEFCISRPMRSTNTTLPGAKVTVIGFKRDKEMSGVTKLALMDGRACEIVPLSKKAASERNQIQLSVRVHANDAVHTYRRGPTVTAWVLARGSESFTVCAETVGNTEILLQTRNSVHVSWIALPKEQQGEQCQPIEKPDVRVAVSSGTKH